MNNYYPNFGPDCAFIMPRVIFDKQKQRRGSIVLSESMGKGGRGEFFRKNLRIENGATKGDCYDRSGGRENDDGSADQSRDN